MTDPTPEAPADTHEGSQEDRIDSLESKVDAIGQKIDQILGLGKKPERAETVEAEDEPANVAAQVRAELAKVKQAEDRKKKADDDLDAKVDAKVKQHIPERPPKEYRRVTNLVWGRDED